MEHFTPSPVYGHVEISNRARALRAKVMADGLRAVGLWVARSWAALAPFKGRQAA